MILAYTPLMAHEFDRMAVGEFLDALAAKTATPGGGSAAAMIGAAGASLGVMACRFTSGEKFKAHAAEMETAITGLLHLRNQLTPLIQADAVAFDRVSAALSLPKNNDAEKAARKAALHQALRGAMEVPHRTMDLSHKALQILQRHAPQLNANLASDVASAVLCLGSAIESAWLNVLTNHLALKDDAEAGKIRDSAEKIRASSADLVASVLGAVQAVLNPK